MILLFAAELVVRRRTGAYRPYDPGHHWWWLPLLLLLLALLILAVGALLVVGSPRRRSDAERQPLLPQAHPADSAEQILAERLARGEISPEEYRRRRDTLRE
jgi:putative membrane protein